MRDVPLVGWDVAFTSKGIFLLEVLASRRTKRYCVVTLSFYLQVNLSCNFFRGAFDVPSYIDMVDKYWTKLDALSNNEGAHARNSSHIKTD